MKGDDNCIWSRRYWRIYVMREPIRHKRFLHLFGLVYFELNIKRVCEIDLAWAPCEDCGELIDTTVSEQWTEADPRGRLVRSCQQCSSRCAG